MTDWSDWEYDSTYCGCKIYKKWQEAYNDYHWGSPCISGIYWTRAAVVKRIEAGGYCNGAPPPSASAYIPSIDYFVDGMPTWGVIWSDPTGPVPVASPNYSDRPAKVNEALYFTVWWQNIGEVAITGHADLELTAPSGAKHNLNAYSGQDKTQSPNIGQGVGFNGLTLDEAGAWSLKAAISYAGIILDKETTTFTVGAPAEEGKAKIIEVNLPDKLSKGDSITGYVKIKNVGTTKERFRHFLTTEWNGKVSKTEADLRPGDVLRVNFYEGGLIMPAQEAHMTIRAQHWDDEIGDWITDDVKTH